MKPAVWVTRPGAGGIRTRDALASAGIAVVHVPLLEVGPVAPPAFPPPAAPDRVILVSVNAVAGLEHALSLPGFPALDPAATRFAAVGRRTAEEARARGWSVDLVPGDERAEGLVEALHGSDLAGEVVWIPTGNREGSATRDLPAFLEGAGASVHAFQVYENRFRAVDEDDERTLQAARLGAVLFHSPSAAEAMRRLLENPSVRRWWEAAALVAIGPVTAARLEALGASRISVCDTPSDEDVVTAVRRLETFRSARSLS